MKKRGLTVMMAVGLVFCFITFGCGGKEAKEEAETEKISFGGISNDITLTKMAIADSILSGMTLEERVGQCLMPSLPAKSDPGVIKLLKSWIKDYHIGGIVLQKGDLKSAKELSDISHSAKVPLIVAIDAEWGLGMRLEDAPTYPKNGNITKETGEVALFDYGQQIARECKETGINMVLGPVIDVTSRRTGIIGLRSFGGDPSLVSDFGIAYAKGVESGGIISVAKHFPGHGGAYQDSHFQTAQLNKTLSALDTIDLSPFKNYIQSDLSGIMAGHIMSDALDPEGKPASVSTAMLTDLLRGEMGFRGLVLTDAFDMGGIRGFSATDALNAGADIIICPVDLRREYEVILNAVKSGELDIKVVNERCARILFYKALFSILPD